MLCAKCLYEITHIVGFDIGVLHKDFPCVDEIAVGIYDIHFGVRCIDNGFNNVRFVIRDWIWVFCAHYPKKDYCPMCRDSVHLESREIVLELLALFREFSLCECRVNIDGNYGVCRWTLE